MLAFSPAVGGTGGCTVCAVPMLLSLSRPLCARSCAAASILPGLFATVRSARLRATAAALGLLLSR